MANQHVVEVFLLRRGGQRWVYAISERADQQLTFGHLVLVPFGRQKLLGIICGTPRPRTATDPHSDKIRPILAASGQPLLTPDLSMMLQWLSRYYFVLPEKLFAAYPLLSFLKIPQLKEKTDFVLEVEQSQRLYETLYLAQTQPPALRSRQATLLWQRLVEANQPLPASAFSDLYQQPQVILKKWLAQGWIKQIQQKRTAKTLLTTRQYKTITLNQEQEKALEPIVHAIIQQEFVTQLLHGITGSGKTEVYIEACRQALVKGKTVLILVPEIALVQPLAERVAQRLGQPVDLWHSALSESVRQTTLAAVLAGEARVIVGARSALFLPLLHLGLIIVDEEHDAGYLHQEGFFIHCRDAAIQRARFAGCPIILGSATPALELIAAAKAGSILYAKLINRAQAATLADVEVVDPSLPQEKTMYQWLSKTLMQQVEETLSRKEQVVLFRNRRGFHPTVICKACSSVWQCPHCSSSLALHARPVRLHCHICGYQQEWQQQCRTCQQTGYLKPVGAGTQRIVEELRQLFPTANIERLDRDQITSATRLNQILQRLHQGDIDILVGTQMITKGLDIERITLVGVINIDGALHLPDFRAAERVFQQICQVAGRAGRGQHLGRVILQTEHPQHPVIVAAMTQNFDAFAHDELLKRQVVGYPPWTKMLRVVWQSEEKNQLVQQLPELVKTCHNNVKRRYPLHDLRLLGPTEAPLERVNKQFRYHLVAISKEREALRTLAGELSHASAIEGLDCSIAIDPQLFY